MRRLPSSSRRRRAGSALVEALDDARDALLPARRRSGRAPRPRSSASSSTRGSCHATEAGDAVDALSTAGLLERALVEAALLESEDALGEDGD